MKTNNTQQLSEIDKAYIAGLLERASFSIAKRSMDVRCNAYTVTIAFHRLDDETLKWVQQRVGGHATFSSFRKNFSTRLHFSGKNTIPLINTCYKYLKNKRLMANMFLIFGSTLKDSKSPRHGMSIALSTEDLEIRNKIYNDFRDITLLQGFNKDKPRASISHDLPLSVSGLFDFLPDSDGFGETIVPKSGFFDDFINHIQHKDTYC